MHEIILLISEMLAASIRMAIPLMLTALGATMCERSGVINIGLEGMMVSGAFFAVVVTYFTNNPWLGLFGAITIGFLLGLLFAVLTVTFRANQIVIGLGINLLGTGGTIFLLQAIFGVAGISPRVTALPRITIPVLNRIPYLGIIIGRHSILVYITFLIVFFLYWLLFRTPFGLRLRAVGENAEASDTAGINVYRMRYYGYIFSGILAGMGGAYLSIGQLNFFAIRMSNGRGFISLAANIFGNWNPIGVLGSTMFFGFAEALRMRLLGFNIPPQFIQMIPFVFTLAILAGVVGKSTPPADIGNPYIKEK